MSDAALVQPDLDFKQKILGLGAHDLTSCYQCGTCSVVCPISTDDEPFPRREMVWVQWGLKDRLLADPAMWLCHQCSLCTTYCPRDARPSDVMASLRDYSISHYARPGFLARAIDEPKHLPLLILIPALIYLIVLGALGHVGSLPTGQIVYSKFMPMIYIEIVMILGAGAAVIYAVLGGMRYWKAMNAVSQGADNADPKKGLLPTVLDIFKHSNFRKCEDERVGTRETHKAHLHLAHLAVFYGFLGLFVTTTSVFIGLYVFDYPTPWPWWHPVKILGNVSGALVVGACAVFMYRRIKDKRDAGKSTYSDWFFVSVLILTAFTGFLTEWIRLANIPPVAYWTYYVHLILVFMLLVYIPYSKFAHIAYRFAAMLHNAGRSAPVTP
jgi:quinone-modifying oxidoreductase subunit QmoC